MIKSFDVRIPIVPIGAQNTDEINLQLNDLGIEGSRVISICIVEVNDNPSKYFTHKVQRVFYRS